MIEKNCYEDSAWERFGYRHPGGDQGAKILSELEKSYGISTPERFLNLCCGDGAGTQWFSRYGKNRWGIDNSEQLIQKAEKNFPDLNWICSDIKHGLPFEDNWADTVLCECALSLFEGELKQVIEEVLRILKPGGLFLVGDITWERVRLPSGFELLHMEEHPQWVREFYARWLWEEGSLPAGCDKGSKSGGLPSYYLAVYRR